MQQRRLGRAWRYLTPVLVMGSAFALLACPGDETTTRNVNASVPLNSSTAAAVLGQTFTFTGTGSDGRGQDTFVLNTSSTFTETQARTNRTTTLRGNVTFGSCTLTITAASSSPAGTGPQVGDIMSFPTCNLTVSASNVTVGGGATNGTVTLVIVDSTGVSLTSSPITLPVSIGSDGTLFVNNVSTGIKP
jgi:hypothetical protein